MIYLRSLFLSALFLLAVHSQSFAQDFMEEAKKHWASLSAEGHIIDTFGYLSADERKQLATVLDSPYRRSKLSIGVVMVPSLLGLSPWEIGQEMRKIWALGGESGEYGVIILYSKDVDELWVYGGQAVFELIPDEELQGIMNQHLRPKWNRGQHFAGLYQGADMLQEVYEQRRAEAAPNPLWYWIMGTFVLMTALGIPILRRGQRVSDFHPESKNLPGFGI